MYVCECPRVRSLNFTWLHRIRCRVEGENIDILDENKSVFVSNLSWCQSQKPNPIETVAIPKKRVNQYLMCAAELELSNPPTMVQNATISSSWNWPFSEWATSPSGRPVRSDILHVPIQIIVWLSFYPLYLLHRACSNSPRLCCARTSSLYES